MDWKRYFSKKVLERGYDYYLDGRVQEIEFENGIYFATVQGNYNYCVQIEPLPNGKYDMYCDCPHAQDGYNCKHMAALMYEITNTKQHSNHNEIILKQIENCSQKEINEFLSGILYDNPSLYQNFRMKFHLLTKEEKHNAIKKELLSIKMYNFYYDYNGSLQYYVQLIDFMKKYLPGLINEEDYSFSFDLIQQIIKKIGFIYTYRTEQEYEKMIQTLYEYLDKLITKTHSTLKEYIFNQLFELTRLDHMYCRDEFIDYLYSRFNDVEYIELKEEIAKDQFNEIIGENRTRALYWLKKYLNIVSDLSKVKELCEQYIEYKEIRNEYIDYLFEHKYDEECIQVLKKWMEQNPKEYSLKLKELYKRMNLQEEYMQCLFQILVEYEGDIPILNEYKNNFTEKEWLNKRNKLFLLSTSNPNHPEFLKEEKLIDELFEYVQKTSFLILQKYEDILKKDYSNECIQMYEKEIDQMLEPVSNRGTYWLAARYIERLSKFEGGKSKIFELKQKYKNLYFRRTALKDELDHIHV